MEEKKIIKVQGSGAKEKRIKKLQEQKEVPLDAQQRLTEIANDTPRAITVGGKKYAITALKWGTQWLIAEEAIKIKKAETASTIDVIQQFAVNIPSTIKVLTLAILNDKDKIFKDKRINEYSDEYYALYDTIEWESDGNEWIKIIAEVLSMINIEVFFYTTETVQTIRQMMTQKKMTMDEVKLSHQEQNVV